MNPIVLREGLANSPGFEQQSRRGLPCLSGLRFFGALVVVLVHFGPISFLPRIFFWFGCQAVSFFFILSGIVLAYSYRDAIISRSIGWPAFFNRRLARIMPVHVATWLIATVMHVWFGWISTKVQHPILSWIAGLLCIQVYWPSPSFFGRWNPPAWSISCELFFYALFPFVLPLLERCLRSISSIIITMSGICVLQVILYLCASGIAFEIFQSGHSFLGYQSYATMDSVALSVFPPLRLGEFLVGMCIGLLSLRTEYVPMTPLKANLLLAICLVGFVLLLHIPGLNPRATGIQLYLFVPFIALTLVAIMSGATVLTPLLQNRIAIFLGEISYPLYLLHSMFTPGAHASIVEYVLRVVACIVSAVILYLFVDRPVRRLWRQVLRSRRPVVPNPSYAEAHGATISDLKSRDFDPIKHAEGGLS
jgi:peptidoglycan/LPS O-acetylase OafA/YrhL